MQISMQMHEHEYRRGASAAGIAGAACLLVALAAGRPAAAGMYQLTFGDLSPHDGATLYGVTEQGFTLTDPSGFQVVGPGSPSYSGSIGLAPLGDWTLAAPAGLPMFAADGQALAIQLAAIARDAGYDLSLAATLSGSPAWTATLAGTFATNPFPGTPPGLPAADTVEFHSVPGSAEPYQFTRLDVVAGAAVPEPPSGLLLGAGAAAAVAAAVAAARRRPPRDDPFWDDPAAWGDADDPF